MRDAGAGARMRGEAGDAAEARVQGDERDEDWENEDEGVVRSFGDGGGGGGGGGKPGDAAAAASSSQLHAELDRLAALWDEIQALKSEVSLASKPSVASSPFSSSSSGMGAGRGATTPLLGRARSASPEVHRGAAATSAEDVADRLLRSGAASRARVEEMRRREEAEAKVRAARPHVKPLPALPRAPPVHVRLLLKGAERDHKLERLRSEDEQAAELELQAVPKINANSIRLVEGRRAREGDAHHARHPAPLEEEEEEEEGGAGGEDGDQGWTQASSATPHPAGSAVPTGEWRRAFAADGRQYFYHSGTLETTWREPAEWARDGGAYSASASAQDSASWQPSPAAVDAVRKRLSRG